MKNILFVLFIFCWSNLVNAQISFEHSLSTAMSKAKSENKMIMLINSTTWCGPCKLMEKNVYPSKEVGDYINANFCTVKYLLDKADPDNIKKTYGIYAYPTYVFLNSQGEEIARMSGGGVSPEMFIKYVKDATMYENTYKGRAERLARDSSYFPEHINFLIGLRKTNEAEKLLVDYYDKHSDIENLSSKNLALYLKSIQSFESTLLAKILTSYKLCKKHIDNQLFEDNLHEFSDRLIFSNGFLREKQLVNNLAIVEKNRLLETPFIAYLKEAKESLFKNDAKKSIDIALKYGKKMTANEISMIVWYVNRNMSKEIDVVAFNKLLSMGLNKKLIDNQTSKMLNSFIKK